MNAKANKVFIRFGLLTGVFRNKVGHFFKTIGIVFYLYI